MAVFSWVNFEKENYFSKFSLRLKDNEIKIFKPTLKCFVLTGEITLFFYSFVKTKRYQMAKYAINYSTKVERAVHYSSNYILQYLNAVLY